MIPATEWDEIVAELSSGTWAAAEVHRESMVSVMSTPPGPLKASTRVWWTERCPSGPFEDDYDAH